MHLSGPIVDTIADYMAIVVLFVVPVLHKMAYGTDRIEHEAAPAPDPGSTGAHPDAPETPLVKRPAAERRD